jgi:Protein of unknown function (DUF998)
MTTRSRLLSVAFMTEAAHAAARTTPRSLVRLAALAGMVGPIAFAFGLACVTWTEYDFLRELGFSVTDHGDSAWPSGLAQGPHGWVQIANYALFGVLVLGFLAELRFEFLRRRSRRVATTLLAMLGLGFVLAAFPEDGPPFGEPQTWAGYLHSFGFLGVVLGSIGGMLATAVGASCQRTLSEATPRSA